MSDRLRGDLQAGALALAGILVVTTLPTRRVDLLAFGVAASLAGMVWRPWVGPALIGASLPFYFFSRTIGPLSFSPPELVLLLAWGALLLRVAGARLQRRQSVAGWPLTGYDSPLALFLVAALLSLLVTEYLLLSVRELRALVFEPVLFFWLLATGGQRASRAALLGFLAAASVAAAAAVLQVVLGIGGTEAEGVRRAQAWYPQPNHLALMLGRAFPFLLAISLDPARRPRARTRTAAWVAAALTGVALLLTFSIGGWIAGAAATVAVLAALGRRGLAAGSLLAAAALLVGVSGLAIVGRLPERLDPLRQTTGFRVDLWQSSLAMLVDHPVLGVGLDNFVYLYQQVYLREGAAAEANLSHPHNWILHVWLQLGVLGLVAFVWLLVRFARYVRRRVARAPATWVVAGAVGAMVDMLLHGLIDNSYFLVDLAFLFWLLLALARDSSATDDTAEPPLAPGPATGSAPDAFARMAAQ